AKVDTAVFDKTGTITEGKFEIVSILALDRDETELLAIAAAAEKSSDHPLAQVIVDEASRRMVPTYDPSDAHVIPGRGVECHLADRRIRAGNASFLAEAGITGVQSVLDAADRLGATAILISDGDRLAGGILLRDRLRQGVIEASEGLDQLGIKTRIMLTGDRRRAAEVIAREACIPEVEAELLPEQKLDRIRQLQSQGRHVAMIGDGINDAPALAAASVGIAVGGARDIPR